MIGNKIYHFESIDSTNEFIKINYESFANGDIVLADKQTNGRGSRGRTWVSPKGNLYFSFIIKEKMRYDQLFPVVMHVSNVIVKLFNSFDIDVKIKYPNDIIYEKKKIAGILIETIGDTFIKSVICGVGININQKDFKKINNTGTSLFMLKNKSFKIENILKKFIELYNQNITEESVMSDYLKNSYILNKKILYNGKEYLVDNISMNGNLILLENGEKISVNMSEISLNDIYE